MLSVPLDLQKEAFADLPDYTPSTALMPRAQSIPPDPTLVDEVASMIAAAERPVVIGGRGAIWSGAGEALKALAEESGALLATTLLAKGLFDGNPFALDIAGGFSSDLTREFFAASDLVIAAGAGLGHYTTDGGNLYPDAKVVQIDTHPRGIWQGLRTADLTSAPMPAPPPRLSPAACVSAASAGRAGAATRSRHGSRLTWPDSKKFAVTPGTLDPRPVLRELDAAVPKDWDIVVAGGHCFSFAMTHLKGRPGGKYHIPIDFGAIGSGLSAAIGVAVARDSDKVMLIDGDGSLYQHIQELEHCGATGSNC